MKWAGNAWSFGNASFVTEIDWYDGFNNLLRGRVPAADDGKHPLRICSHINHFCIAQLHSTIPNRDSEIPTESLYGLGMTTEIFEEILSAAAAKLTKEIRKDSTLHVPRSFEDRARIVLRDLAKEKEIDVDEARPQTFPDIVLGSFGVEVKVANKDTWRSVANSVFEGTRNIDVKHIYILFGKMGGTPEVR